MKAQPNAFFFFFFLSCAFKELGWVIWRFRQHETPRF